MYFADLIGRKKVILMGLALHAGIDLLLLLLPKKLYMLYIYMSLLGVRAPMASHVVSVMNYEYSVTKIRGYLTATTTLLDNVTGILLSLFFYYAGDW